MDASNTGTSGFLLASQPSRQMTKAIRIFGGRLKYHTGRRLAQRLAGHELWKLGILKLGIPKLGIFKLGIFKLGNLKLGNLKLGILKLGILKLGILQSG